MANSPGDGYCRLGERHRHHAGRGDAALAAEFRHTDHAGVAVEPCDAGTDGCAACRAASDGRRQSTRLGYCNDVRYAFAGRFGDWRRVLDDCEAIALAVAPYREDATGAFQALRTPDAE